MAQRGVLVSQINVPSFMMGTFQQNVALLQNIQPGLPLKRNKNY